jgi:hypothetical protein
MTTGSTNDREWFTPVWVVPALLLVLVIVYSIARGSPDSAAALQPAIAP